MEGLLEKINKKFDYLMELYSDSSVEEIKKGIEISKEAINREIENYKHEMLIKKSEMLIKDAEKIFEKYPPERRDNWESK